MKARIVLPIGMAGAVLCGAALSGIMPTRMAGIGDEEALQSAPYEAENFDSTSGLVANSQFDHGPDFAQDLPPTTDEAEDQVERAWYESDAPVEISPAELARARHNPDYASIPDEFEDTPEPLPVAPRTHDYATYPGPSYPQSSRFVAAPTTPRNAPADTRPPIRHERTLDPIY